MDDRENQPSKRELLESLLAEGMVLIHLDASNPGVDVPPGLRDEHELGLNLSYRFAGPLAVDEAGVYATLSFSGEPYACALPFDAVYAMVSHDTGEGFFFPTEAPPSALAALAAALEDGEGAISEVPATEAAVPERPKLSVIDGGAPPAVETEEDTEGEQAREAGESSPPRLRLVK
ncbi:MAG: ClpXP protease specificity-enhancing factor SspB [Deltaproteobacteria bacterium]|nr:ClpXP protease specificity-enhancing factor SspB [Deltaproteobacteria bacterium]